MAIYEYFCPTCRSTFEQRRPMVEANAPAACSSGHVAERTITRFAIARGASSTAVEAVPMSAEGGCCGGGGCACGH